MDRLKEKVALVTGSGRGFGRSVASAYAVEGARVVSVARTESELERTADIIRSKGGEVLTIPADLSESREILRVRDEVMETYGRLDVLFNNAATNPWKVVEDMTVEDWDRVIAVNLRAPFLLTKTFIGAMRAQGGGSVVNVSSASAVMGFVAEAAYCPSKYALEGLTQCLAMELRPYNIAVNSLNVGAPPGKSLKPTELTEEETRKVPDEVRERYADVDSMVEAFTDAWTFVALQNGSGITGQRLHTRLLAEELEESGWEATSKKYVGRLTKAIYKPYEFPESVRYQTRDGGWKELKFG
jgi:NAD(P)-dependent dehydrogenase (short-subunit alcohol dehydrogenase family)